MEVKVVEEQEQGVHESVEEQRTQEKELKNVVEYGKNFQNEGQEREKYDQNYERD
jgi:hypothetical protein